MSVLTSREPVVDPAVMKFLKSQGAEAEFQLVCGLAQTFFPELQTLEVELFEDPDEENWLRVRLRVTLPNGYSLDLLRTQVRRYHDAFIERVPLARCPLFVLLTDFARE